ncbi:MAG: hypothetical protein JSR46_00365 [Verrucomicrobia bacterium]|nr:hypothetical protein [Verrucomicrobiota bacterium]
MIRLSHAKLYAISGAVWLVIGVFLLNLGLQLVVQGIQGEALALQNYSSFFTWLASLSRGYENAAIALIAISIMVGFLKGRLVLGKVAMRTQNRLQALENPTSLTNLYTKANFLIIAMMMGFGMLMRYFNVPNDIRGPIDIAVGTALIQGSVAYFTLTQKKAKS